MSYIDYINRFWQCEIERVTAPSDAKLYFYLLHTCNALRWKQPFGHSDRHLSFATGMAVNTVRESKNRLKQLGLIDFQAPPKGSKGIDGQTKFWLPTVSKNDTVPDTVADTVSDTVPDTVPDTNYREDKEKIFIDDDEDDAQELAEILHHHEKRLLSDDKWLYSAAKGNSLKLPGGHYDTPRVEELVARFFAEQLATGNRRCEIFGEAKSHCYNWIRLQIEKQLAYASSTPSRNRPPSAGTSGRPAKQPATVSDDELLAYLQAGQKN